MADTNDTDSVSIRGPLLTVPVVLTPEQASAACEAIDLLAGMIDGVRAPLHRLATSHAAFAAQLESLTKERDEARDECDRAYAEGRERERQAYEASARRIVSLEYQNTALLKAITNYTATQSVVIAIPANELGA